MAVRLLLPRPPQPLVFGQIIKKPQGAEREKVKKLIVCLLLLLPLTAFAKGGGFSGGFHSSSGSFHSSSSGSFRSSGSIGSSGAFHSSGDSSYSSGSISRGSYFSGGTTHVYDDSLFGGNFWFYLWLVDHNNDQRYKNDAVTSKEHFPYVLILDTTAKDYTLVRYIGPDNKTEKVSPQEAAGLTWLKGEIKY